jgi:hypothetical protein
LTDSNSATPLLISEETIHFIVRSQTTGKYGSIARDRASRIAAIDNVYYAESTKP